MGRTPMEHCDTYVAAFQYLLQRLSVSNSSFVRTTNDAHKISAQVSADGTTTANT
jgi:methionyl-tRNA synthetase